MEIIFLEQLVYSEDVEWSRITWKEDKEKSMDYYIFVDCIIFKIKVLSIIPWNQGSQVLS